MSENGVAFVDALNSQFGKFPGCRAIHAKGRGASGRFVANGAAAAVTTAAHLQKGEVPVIVRFSNGDGNPTASDGAAFSRGFAVRFLLPDNTLTDILSIVASRFVTNDPSAFLALILALTPDEPGGKPDGLKLAEFALRHPLVMARVIEQQRGPVPESFATVAWHAIHAFIMTNADGKRQAVKYRWVPTEAVALLERDEAVKRDGNYLMSDLDQRLSVGEVTFDLELTLGKDDDPTDEPYEAWPEDRQTIIVGRLHLDSPATVDPLKFSPVHLVAGIDRSDDPLLAARPAIYSVSQDRRSHPKP